MSNLAQIFENYGKSQVKKVFVESLGADVWISKQTLQCQLEYEQALLESRKQAQYKNDDKGDPIYLIKPNELAKIRLKHCVLDEDGKPFLSDAMLLNLPVDLVNQLIALVDDFNGQSVDVSDVAVAETAKN